ncbi:MAG: O-antigen ligase domain-containing protein [Cyanosarcina radialis HA8281-LM2]|jgi:hypothetical protein|nr:O-antigen ligase domain-containing protein [Cyanosarcina radialis HA8281-LM2]
MMLLTYLVMLAWIPIVLLLFKQFSPERAVVISFIGAWLFLPQVIFPLPGLPDYSKMSATCYGILLATIIYDVEYLKSFKFGWLDIPMLIWCLCPFASSITNGLGVYDGLSTSLTQTVTWGVPYFLGRIYLNDLAGLRQLAVGIFMGGLLYIPLCWVEIFLSPILHEKVYGLRLPGVGQSIRYGGYRPMVFMKHGLEVGMWMMAATLIGIWLWRSGAIHHFWNVSMIWLVGALLVTFVAVKSTGAYLYLILGVGILFIAKYFRTVLPMLALVLTIMLYVSLGASGTFGQEISSPIVSLAADVAGPDRAQSLQFRWDHEELLGEKARQKVIFGWGGWGRNRIKDEITGEKASVTDSLWVIAFGINGLVGLASITAAFLLPAASFCFSRYRVDYWSHPKLAAVAVLAVVLILYMLDCTLNSMINPIYALANGGLSGLLLQERQANKTAIARSSAIKPYYR